MRSAGSPTRSRLEFQNNRLWSIVLAGGEGIRTREFIKRELGVTKPKQYCSFVGTRSLLQHTIDRADELSQPERRVVVAAREHRHHALSQMEGRSQGTLLFQPRNQGTAPGVFLPLTYVFAKAPEATVVIYPSDHFVYPESAFNRAIADGIALADELSDRLVLLGASPQSRETDYGWIRLGNPVSGTRLCGAHDVAYFVEKPTKNTAEAAFRRGALWNTFIIIGKVKTLWGLGWRYLPEMMVPFAEPNGRREATEPSRSEERRSPDPARTSARSGWKTREGISSRANDPASRRVAIMLTILSRYWWTFLLRGILAVLFGLAAFFWPAITLAALVLLFGAFAFADGFLTLVAAIRGRDSLDRWWLYLLGGLAGIAAGILTFFWPGMTAIALLMFIAAWAIVTGVLEIAAAIRLRKEIVGEWALALAGVLSVLFGVILVMRPGAGALAVVWLIGIYAVAFGIAMIMLAFRLRGLSKELASAPA